MRPEIEKPAVASGGASGSRVHAAKLNTPEDKQAKARNQVLRADLVGSNTCSAAGIVATGNAPMLSLCRRLIAAGHDPGTCLEVYRGNTLALGFRSIGEAAKLTVRESTRDGRPRFVRLSGGDVGPPMRKSASVTTADWIDWPAATDGGAARKR